MIKKADLTNLLDHCTQELASLLMDALDVAAIQHADRGRFEKSQAMQAVQETLDEHWKWEGGDPGYELDDDVLEVLRPYDER